MPEQLKVTQSSKIGDTNRTEAMSKLKSDLSAVSGMLLLLR